MALVRTEVVGRVFLYPANKVQALSHRWKLEGLASPNASSEQNMRYIYRCWYPDMFLFPGLPWFIASPGVVSNFLA